VGTTQPEPREGMTGHDGVAERFVVLKIPGNAGGGKGPQFKRRSEGNDNRESDR
jgi:hypothetical protein